MIRFFGKTNIDFLTHRHTALTISGLAILAGLISLVLHNGPNYSIDVEGGLAVLLRITEPEGKPKIDEEMVRNSLDQINLGNAEVKMSRSEEGEDILVRFEEEGQFRPAEALIRGGLEQLPEEHAWRIVPDENLAPDDLPPNLSHISHVVIATDTPKRLIQAILDSLDIDNPKVFEHKTIDGQNVLILSGEGRDSVSKLRRVLAEDYPDYQIDIRSIDRVGPRIGSELRIKALFAIFAALGLIIIYLWWRFEFLFGVAAVIALFHDVIITLGLFSILNLEISIIVIGAFLTLVGYSLNDTIVIFDRIRENIKRYKDADYTKVINRSINDNLSRTIVTSLTTLLVVLVLFFKGGEVLHSFALALLAGIIVGTYSSIYIASPILVDWAQRTGKTAGKKLKRR